MIYKVREDVTLFFTNGTPSQHIVLKWFVNAPRPRTLDISNCKNVFQLLLLKLVDVHSIKKIEI